MTEVLSLANVMRIGKLGFVSVCLIGILIGCSSKSKTTVMRGMEPLSQSQEVEMKRANLQPDKAVQRLSEDKRTSGNPSVEIPVEEPARPFIRPSTPEEIFATPRTDVGDPDVPRRPEAPLIAESETSPPSHIAVPNKEHSFQEPSEKYEIPPISMDPENPALPTIRESTSLKESQQMNESGSVSPPPPPLETRDAEPLEPTPKQDESNQKAEGAPFASEEKSGEFADQAPKSEEPQQITKIVPLPAEPDSVESRNELNLNVLEDVYFDYDRFTIRNDAIPVLEGNAETLVTGLLDKHVVIEGHCDQRGTESYNMVLGKRRANAVKEFLVNLGVPSGILQVVSYGKEKLFCTDHNEHCWQANRRGHFILK